MERLLLAGAGGLGGEIASWLEGCIGFGSDWEFAGFLSDVPDALAGRTVEGEIVGSIAGYRPRPDESVAVALGDPGPRLAVVETLRQRGARFRTLVHRSAVVGRHVTLGEGVIVAPLTFIGGGAVIGDFVLVNVSATVAHDVRIGAGSTLSGHCDVTGGVQLGREVFLGTHACVIPRVTVGDRAHIGAGSVVLQNVAAGDRMFGVPARRISGSVETPRDS